MARLAKALDSSATRQTPVRIPKIIEKIPSFRNMTAKPFSPWKPGDAYSYADAWTHNPLLQMSFPEGKQVK